MPKMTNGRDVIEVPGSKAQVYAAQGWMRTTEEPTPATAAEPTPEPVNKAPAKKATAKRAAKKAAPKK